MARKIGTFLLLLLIGAGIYGLYQRLQPAPTMSQPIEHNLKPVVQGVADEKPTIFVPERLRIERLKVDALIESVGLDKDKRMDVPKDDLDVAWYKNGAIPGEKGSAVLAGHFDKKDGGPAVFYHLSDLSKGDTVIITGKDGEERTFIVTDKQIFKDATFPVSLVFSQNDTERLNLITCDGVFDKNEKNYTDRLVVFTKLKRS